MTIRIINGTFGYNDGKKVIPLNKDNGEIDFLPKDVEKRLVEVCKIAEYVEDKPAKKAEEKKEPVIELDGRKVEELEYKELQALYKQLELGSPVSKKTDFLIAAIKEALGEDEEAENEEVGESNGDNLVPDESETESEDGKDESDSEEDAEGVETEEDEDGPNLKDTDGVA